MIVRRFQPSVQENVHTGRCHNDASAAVILTPGCIGLLHSCRGKLNSKETAESRNASLVNEH